MPKVGSLFPASKKYLSLPGHRAAAHVLLLLIPISASAQNVGISTATPDKSAILEMQSTSQGFLPPRLTNTQMTNVSLPGVPATGDLVYNSTYVNYYFYNGSIWTPMIGSGWSLTGDAGTNPSTNFLGTKDAVDLVQKTNNMEHLRIYNGGNVGLTNSGLAETLFFYEASGLGTKYNAFKAGVQTADTLGVIIPHYVWPLGGDGIPNQCLVTDGTGNLSWHTFATFGGSGLLSLWKRGSAAGGEYSDSTGSSDSGPYSIAAGFHTTVTGNYETVFGDSTSGVSGSYADVAGGSGNSSTGNYDVSLGGQDNQASATASNICGGENNYTSGNEESVIDGFGATFSGSNSTIIGGWKCKTTANYECLYGYNFTDGTTGSMAFDIGTHTLMGLNTTAPTQAMDVVGNVRFSGALKPNNTGGSNGNYLLSAGAGVHPTWGAIAIAGTFWRLVGVSGTVPATNYIGTTDAQHLAIRTSDVERMRITSAGNVGIGTTTPLHPLTSIFASTTDETASIYGEASGATASQAVGVWGTSTTAAANTGTIGVLATGNGNTMAGTTNAAIQISQGEFGMGRTTEPPLTGSDVEPAASGVLYSQQGPSGVIQLSMQADLGAGAPTAGVYQDLGAVTITNRYINSNSIVLADVVQKTNGGGSPDPKNSVYKVDVQSTTAGQCTFRLGMIPFVTDANSYQGSDQIRIAYLVINPGR
ncbi:MAG TPA: hypothetical protein VGM92_11925 [Candidatus Kapabacteria bacterium]|jgi:hypothetical protein